MDDCALCRSAREEFERAREVYSRAVERWKGIRSEHALHAGLFVARKDTKEGT